MAPVCIDCRTKPARKYYGKQPRNKQYRSTCNDCHHKKIDFDSQGYKQDYKRRHYEQNRTHYLDCNTRRLYGIPLEDYLALRKAQNGLCYICRKHFADKDLGLDHNHITMQNRRFLCRKCNLAVAVVEDNPLLEAVIKYLEEF